MVFTRFGNEFEIVGYVTDVEVGELAHPVTLVKSREGDFQFAEFLKADGGFHEIDAMLKLAEPLNISVADLQQAINEAM